jgi:hypothetical protein
LGESTGFSVAAITTSVLGRYLSAASEWVFLSRDRSRISSLMQFAKMRQRQPLPEKRATPKFLRGRDQDPLWTDEQ